MNDQSATSTGKLIVAVVVTAMVAVGATYFMMLSQDDSAVTIPASAPAKPGPPTSEEKPETAVVAETPSAAPTFPDKAPESTDDAISTAEDALRRALDEARQNLPALPEDIGTAPQLDALLASARDALDKGDIQATQRYLAAAAGLDSGSDAVAAVRERLSQRLAALEDNLSVANRRTLQQVLTDLGYDTNGVDGVFGRGTRSAINRFQQAQGVAVTGYLTPAQVQSLLSAADERRQQAEQLAQQTAEERRRMVEETLANATALARQGQLQAGLERLQAALERYPDDAELEGLRQQLQQRFAETALSLDTTTRQQVQQALAALGYETGAINGEFGNLSRGAIADYQRRIGAAPTGYLDQGILNQLFQDAQAVTQTAPLPDYQQQNQQNQQEQVVVDAYNRAAALGNQGRFQEALQAVASGLAIAPDDGRLRDIRRRLEADLAAVNQQRNLPSAGGLPGAVGEVIRTGSPDAVLEQLRAELERQRRNMGMNGGGQQPPVGQMNLNSLRQELDTLQSNLTGTTTKETTEGANNATQPVVEQSDDALRQTLIQGERALKQAAEALTPGQETKEGSSVSNAETGGKAATSAATSAESGTGDAQQDIPLSAVIGGGNNATNPATPAPAKQ